MRFFQRFVTIRILRICIFLLFNFLSTSNLTSSLTYIHTPPSRFFFLNIRLKVKTHIIVSNQFSIQQHCLFQLLIFKLFFVFFPIVKFLFLCLLYILSGHFWLSSGSLKSVSKASFKKVHPGDDFLIFSPKKLAWCN